MAHLILSIRFLDNRYHGQTDNGSVREWPPSPFRLFQAIVPGNAVGVTIRDDVAAALHWLETLPPPLIVTPMDRRDGTEILTYVLNNVSDSNPNSRAGKMIRPTVLGDDRCIEYVWTFAPQPNAANHALAITRAVRRVRALGWGIDLAIGHGVVTDRYDVADNRTIWRAVADDRSDAGLRVPTPGSLESLRATYADFLRRYETPGVTRLESAGAIYDSTRYVTGVSRRYVVFRLMSDDAEDVPLQGLRPGLIAPLVGMMRGRLHQQDVIKRFGTDVVDRDLLGHPAGSVDRVSIVPLPTTRDGPCDGLIRRVMLAQSSTAENDLTRPLAILLDGQILQPKEGEARFPERIRLERISGTDALIGYYTKTSCVWSSVTPVLLPGYDDRKVHKGNHTKRLARAEQLLCKAIVQSGITASVCDIELSRVPFVSGARHAGQYLVRDKLANYPRYHVRVRFKQEISGPLNLGAGRHAGFGAMVSI